MHNRETQEIKSLQNDLNKGASYAGGHFHNPEAPHRNKYPEDYDSTSDYEVRKIGEAVKHIEDHRKQIENVKKSLIESAKETSGQIKAVDTSA